MQHHLGVAKQEGIMDRELGALPYSVVRLVPARADTVGTAVPGGIVRQRRLGRNQEGL